MLEWQQQQIREVKIIQLFTIPHMRQAPFVSIILHLSLQLCSIAGASAVEDQFLRVMLTPQTLLNTSNTVWTRRT